MNIKSLYITWSAILLLCGPMVSRAQCDVIQNTIDSYVYSQDNFGQSFTACETGVLTRLDVPSHHFLTGDIESTLSIYEGDGYDGEILYTAEVLLSDEWGGFIYHNLSDSIPVVLGEMYTFRLDYHGEYGVLWGSFANAYDGGQNYWNSEPQEQIDMGFSAHIFNMESACLAWTGINGNDWHDPQNWSPNQVPSAANCVEIGLVPSGNQVEISGTAEVGSMSILAGAGLRLLPEEILSIHGDLLTEDQTVFEGLVIIESEEEVGSIGGSPIFERLRINGLFYTSEPFEVLQVLDLQAGYLINPGSELYVHTGEGYVGHVYMPEENIVGDIIFKKHLATTGEQVLGLPFTNATAEDISLANGLTDVRQFSETAVFENFNDNWTAVSPEMDLPSVKGAIAVQTTAPYLMLQGQTDNQSLIVLNEEEALYDDQGVLRVLANPYPSIVDWTRVERPVEAHKAIYGWNPETQQYGAYVGGLSTHEKGTDLQPTDAIMLELAIFEQLDFNYNEVVIAVDEIEQASLEAGPDHHQLRLQARTDAGFDETLIVLSEEATEQRDAAFDALKIPSLNPAVPTFGSMGGRAKVLAINSLPHPERGDVMTLYLRSGTEGSLTIDPVLIDAGGSYGHIYLYDTQLDQLHAFDTQGSYQTQTSFDDSPFRFELHFGKELDVLGLELGEESPWNIHVVRDELRVSAVGQTEMIQTNTHVTVYTMAGKLILDQMVVQDSPQYSHRVYASPGYYMVSVSDGSRTMTQKIWLDSH